MGYEGELGESTCTFRVVLNSLRMVVIDTVPSGKAGLGIGLTDALGAYGEVSFQGSGDSDIDQDMV